MKKTFSLIAICATLMSSVAHADYQDGTLLKEIGGSHVYEIKNNHKILILDTSIIGSRKPIEVDASVISQIQDMPVYTQYKSPVTQTVGSNSYNQSAQNYAPPQKTGAVVNTKSQTSLSPPTTQGAQPAYVKPAQEVSMGGNTIANVTVSSANAPMTLQQLQQLIDNQLLHLTQVETMRNNISAEQSNGGLGFLRNKTAEDTTQRYFEQSKQLAIKAKEYAAKGNVENGGRYWKESLNAEIAGGHALDAANHSYEGNINAVYKDAEFVYQGAKLAGGIVSNFVPGSSPIMDGLFHTTDYAINYTEQGSTYATKELVKDVVVGSIAGSITNELSPALKGAEGKFISSGPVIMTLSKGMERSAEHAIKGAAYLATEKVIEKGVEKSIDFANTKIVNGLPPMTSCGNSKSLRAALQINEVKQAIKGGFSFEAACETHDACYDNCQRTKMECDSEFHKIMTATCAGATNQPLCLGDRNVYYSAVSQHGERAPCTNAVNGSIVRARGKKEVYLIQNNQKLFAPDIETLVANKLDPRKLVEIDASVLGGIQTGLPLHPVKLGGSPSAGGQPSQNIGAVANHQTNYPPAYTQTSQATVATPARPITPQQGQQPPAQTISMSGNSAANITAANDAWNDCARRLGPSFSQKLSTATSSKGEFIRRQKEVFDELDKTCGKQLPDGVKQQILASMQNYVPPAQNHVTVATAPVQTQATVQQPIHPQAQMPPPQLALQPPQIQAVNPNQVVGSNNPQTLTLTGNNFQRGMKVTVKYTGGGSTLPDTHVEVLSQNQARISIITQTVADNWTVQVTNPNGSPSNMGIFRVVTPMVAAAPVQQQVQAPMQPPAQPLARPAPFIIPAAQASVQMQPSYPIPQVQATVQPQPIQSRPQQLATPTLAVNGVANSYSTTTTPYQPTIAITGSGFNSVTRIDWTCTTPRGSSCGTITPWTSANWNGKFIRYSDTQAVVAPMLLVSADPTGMYNWSVTFHGTGSPVTKVFSATKR